MQRHAEALTAVARLHADVDARATALAGQLGARLQCKRGCSGCCVDGITVFAVEAERIRAEHGELLAHAAPHPAGACAFLDADGACRIYAARPYVCRTQGLPLRWIDEEREAELRDICPLNETGEPIEQLPASACWTLGETEARLAQLQREYGAAGERTSLRDLFETHGRPGR